MRDLREESFSLEKDESIQNTFEGGLELKKSHKTISGNLVLTNQNIVFLEEGKGALFSTPLENILSVMKGAKHNMSISIRLINTSNVRFFPSKMNYASVNELCALIDKQISARKNQLRMTAVDKA